MPMYADSTSYLEEYFFNFYLKNKDKFPESPQYLPVFWTPIYVQNAPIPVQSYIDALDQSKDYFTIVQYDEGVLNKLPANTKVFAAASSRGNGKVKIPIPLIVSPIPSDLLEGIDNTKKYLCSFVGRMTHPIRQKLNKALAKEDGFYFSEPEQWSQTLHPSKLNEFFTVTKQSVFSISAEGNAPTAFRLYEIFQLRSIPVYVVSSYHWLPWVDELDWSEFCVLIKEDQIPDLKSILEAIPEETRQKMLDRGAEVYKSHFTLENTCKHILNRL